jgi:hypothetical protein
VAPSLVKETGQLSTEARRSGMLIMIEVEVTYDDPEAYDFDELDETEMADAVAGAISDCDGIINAASVEVRKLTISNPQKKRKAVG